MRKAVLPLLLSLLLLAGCSAPAPVTSGYKQISMQEAIEMMAVETDFILLDVRTAAEYADGHIPGAVLLPNESIGIVPMDQLPDKDRLILVYCRSGNRSKQAADKLAKLGYTHVVEFGGINSWPGDIVTD